MENELPIEPASGSTSPTYPRSLTSGAGPTEVHIDTESVTSAENVSVSTAFILPPVPANTPATQSVVDGMTSLNLAGAHLVLSQLPGAMSPASSEASNASTADEELMVVGGGDATADVGGDARVEGGKAHLRAQLRADIPLLRQLFKVPPKQAKRGWKRAKSVVVDASRSSTPTPKTISNKKRGKGKENVSPPNEHVHEHSVWEDIAREDLTRGIERTKQYALDKFKIDDSKTAREYFNELLADVIKKADMSFDAKYLK